MIRQESATQPTLSSAGDQVALRLERHSPRRFSVRFHLFVAKRLVFWGFLLPLLLFNGVVIIGPTIANVYYSLTDWSGFGAADFIGLRNYQNLLVDDEFKNAFIHNLIWTVFFLTVPIIMALVGAFLLSQIQRFQIFFRAAFFLPYTISTVINANIWEGLLNPQRGLGQLGLPILKNTYFLGQSNTALLSVAFVNNWAFWGFLVVIFLAAMQSVDYSLYEAARVDGANVVQQFWAVTVPGILPTLSFMVLIIIAWSLITFDYVFVMTQGGPAGASELVSTLMYRTAFTRNEVGYAAAMSLSLTFLAILAVWLFNVIRKRGFDI